MPPAVNPNPTRAKRVRNPVEYTDLREVRVRDEADDSDRSEEVVAVVERPPPAAVVVRQEGGPGPAMDLTPARATGVNSLTVPLRRHNEPKRSHPAWAFVHVLDVSRDRNCPLVQCLCGNTFSGSSSRISAHVLGLRGSKACEGEGPLFEAAKVRLLAHVAKEDAKKERKGRVALANAAARAPPLSVNTAADSPSQPTLVLEPTERSHVDKAIGRFFYGCNIPANVADHPLWLAVVQSIRCAPPIYKPPHRHAMYGGVLDSVVTDLRMVEEPIRQSVLARGGTILSDGWDSISRDHLINLLSGNTSGIFFDGTFCLASDDHEDAKAVAELLINFSIRIGWLSVVQVCTDTCAVMQGPGARSSSECRG